MKRIRLFTSLFFVGFGCLLEAASKPSISKLYATPYAEEILQYNDAGDQGTLDDSFGEDGSLDLDAPDFQAKVIQVLDDGTFIVAMNNPSSNSILKKYNADGSIVISFGSDGIVDLGDETIVPVQSMMIDSQGKILVGGGSDNSTIDGWLKRVSADGDTVETFVDGAPWSFIAGIAQQTTGKIIVVGYNGTHAQIGRYDLDGVLDTSGTAGVGFGTTGLIVFDGTNDLSSTQGLYNVILDDYDYIFVTYLDGTSAKTLDFDEYGVIDEEYWPGIISIPYLDGCVVETMHLALDADYYNVIVGASVDSVGVKLTSIDYDNGDSGSFTQSTITDFNYLLEIIPTVDTKVLLVGFNYADPNYDMAVMRLTADGLLDTSTANDNIPFNTIGYNLFHIGDSITSSILYAGSIAPNGQLFVVGFEESDLGQTPYVSRLYNAPFVSAVPQYPITNEQGSLDITFGTNSTQSFRGVVMPYNGFFGGSLLQQPRSIVELSSSNFLIGSDGYTGSNPAYKTMMLTWLRYDGEFNTAFGAASTGKLTLPNVSASDETMTAIAVSSSGIIYTAGTQGVEDTPLPFIRSYSSEGVAITSDLVDTGIASVGIAMQGSFGILLFAQDDATTGHISRYTAPSGVLALDETFGVDGKITTDDLGLNMGSVYGGGLVNRAQSIIVGYKDSVTGAINVAMINKDGTALISEFGTAGIASDVFGDTTISATNVRISFDTDFYENIYIAAVNEDGDRYLITRFNHTTGTVDTTFNGGNVLEILPEASPTGLVLTNLTGVSDGTVMLTGYDGATNPTMLTMRVASADSVAALDITFNSQGTVPGVVPIQIENETGNYDARVATGLAIQSSNYSNQGNVVLSAYEQQISSQSTPEIMRFFGTEDTTQTQRFLIDDQSPGTFFISNPRALPTLAAIIFLYGNNPSRFRSFLGAELFAEMITDADAKNAVIDQINLSFDQYILAYENEPNINLAASTTPIWDDNFTMLEVFLLENHPDSYEEIVNFFVKFNRRRLAVHNVLEQYSSQ